MQPEVQAARVQAARVALDGRIGHLILDRQGERGWGAKVTARLGADLRAEAPAMRGLSPRNLAYMRASAAAFDVDEIVQQPVAQLLWGQVTVLLDKLDGPAEWEFYADRAATSGWSRAVLAHQITTGLRERTTGAVTNFPATLGADSDLVSRIVHNPRPV